MSRRRRSRSKRGAPRTTSAPERSSARQPPPEPGLAEGRRRRVWPWAAISAVVVVAAGLGAWLLVDRSSEIRTGAPSVEVPAPDTAAMEPRVALLVQGARAKVQARPRSAAAWGYFGAVSQAHGLYEVAIPCYRQAVELDPVDFRWPYLLAVVLEIEGAPPEEVVELLDEAARIRPRYPIVPLQLGEALMRQGKLPEAHAAFSRAVELDPELAVAYLGLGQVLVAQSHPREALDRLERAMKLGGEDGRIYSAMAQAYARLGETEQAEQAARKSQNVPHSLPIPDPVRYQIEELGISARHCYHRAKMMMETGNFDGAIEQLEIVSETQPDNPDVEYRLGACFARTGKRDEAVDHLVHALKLDGQHSGAHEEMGRLLAREGKYSLALPHLETFVRLRPDSARGHWFLGQVLDNVGRLDEAREHYRRAVELDPDSRAAERL